MRNKPTYEELQAQIQALERQVTEIQPVKTTLSESGDCNRIEGIRQDITASRSLAKNHLADAKRWQDTFNAMSEALSLMDLDFRISHCNRALCRLVGKPEAEIIGRYCWYIMHGSDQPIQNCPIPIAKKIRQRSMSTVKVGNRHFEVAVDPQYDENNDHIGYIHIMSDITERKRAETALREAHQTLLTVLNSFDATIYVADMETYEILFMNRHMRETYDGDFTGQLCWQAFLSA